MTLEGKISFKIYASKSVLKVACPVPSHELSPMIDSLGRPNCIKEIYNCFGIISGSSPRGVISDHNLR